MGLHEDTCYLEYESEPLHYEVNLLKQFASSTGIKPLPLALSRQDFAEGQSQRGTIFQTTVYQNTLLKTCLRECMLQTLLALGEAPTWRAGRGSSAS